MQPDFDYLFKFLLIGNSSVGKSSLLLRFSDNVFNDGFLPTIGVDFKIRTFELEGKTVKLQIWDSAGQERFKNITQSYYKGAHGFILVYDVTVKQTFIDLENWLADVKHANENPVQLIVGNKIDLESKREVTFEEGKALADSLHAKFIETSAMNSHNVEQVFMTLASELKSNMTKQNETEKVTEVPPQN